MEILNYARATALGVVVTLAAAGSPEELVDEYQVKAAFLYNFAKFVQWPSEAFQSSDEPLAICVLGQDPFGRSLENTVAGQAIEGRSLIVRHISSVKQAGSCHVLFVSSAENQRSLPLLEEITKPGVLTIGDSSASTANDAVINFTLKGGKVRFDINVEAAEHEKLKISSRLLSLARIVQSKQKR